MLMPRIEAGMNFMDGKKYFDEYSRFVRRISFGNCPDYLWGEGTAFFVSYGSDFFLVTARHNILKDSISLAEHLLVTLPGTKKVIPFDMYLTNYDSSEDVQDFAIFRVDVGKALSMGIEGMDSLEIESKYLSSSLIADGEKLWFAGYPTPELPYDWDERKIFNHMLIKDGYKSKSDIGEFFGQFNSTSSELEWSGVSGSPVFAEREDKYYWIGMVVRGSGAMGILHFLNAEIIVRAIESSVRCFEKS